jgi:nicotinamide mononucleotide adenylyltransferase
VSRLILNKVMYDITTTVIRGQGGPHKGHEALMRAALENTVPDGTFVLFLGSAQARREPSNPFSWLQRRIPFGECLERIKTEIGSGVTVRILPLRDRLTNLHWANKLYSGLVQVARETGADLQKMAIVDANKNGDQSNYKDWFSGKLNVLQVGIIEGIHATNIREEFFLEEKEPGSIEGLTPEAIRFLSNWKDSSGAFEWLQNEFRFKEGFAKPLSDQDRAVVCYGSRVLLFRRNCVRGPGCNQYDLPLVGSSLSVKGESDGFDVHYPGIDDLLPRDINLRVVNESYNSPLVRLYDGDVHRENDFFGVQNGWHQFPVIGSFLDRASLLSTPLFTMVYPTLENKHPTLYTPEWVEFGSLPSIEFFRRETVLYLERVLGEIPVCFDGHEV